MTAAYQLVMFAGTSAPAPTPPATDSTAPSQSVASIPTPPKSGRQLRDEAIDRVEANADAGWMERAEQALRSLCAESGRYELTSDDVWRLLGDEDRPREPRALGAVFRRGLALGIIEKTGRVVQSKRRENHAREIAVWRVS